MVLDKTTSKWSSKGLAGRKGAETKLELPVSLNLKRRVAYSISDSPVR